MNPQKRKQPQNRYRGVVLRIMAQEKANHKAS
jgi:hypothetical protein